MTHISFQGGSYADHEALSQQLETHARAQFWADFFVRVPELHREADRQYMRLTELAFRCGYRARTMDETAEDFAVRRTNSFNRERGKI